MKKVFILLFLIVSVIFQLNCKSTTADNSNSANANSSLTFGTNQTNTNVKPPETPLPEFTDAGVALAEGKKLLDANETEKSIEALRQAVKLNPDLAEAHFNLGIAYALLENEEEDSQAVTEEATPTPPKNKKRKKGEEELPLTPSQKAFESAAKLYEKIIEKDPKNDLAFFDLGRSYNKLNKDEEAEKAFRQAVKLKPDDAYYQIELGAILIKLSHYDEAIPVLKKARSLDENNSQVSDLLEKAEAGERRIKFGAKPSPPPQTAQDSSKNRDNKAKQRPTPPLKIEDAPLPKINSNN